jgi:hypothetical protein
MCADEILEVMKTSRQRWTTLRGRGRDWRHNVRRREAFMRDVSSDTQTLTVFSEGFEPPDRSEQEESLWRLWISLPDTIRTEFPVGTGTVTAVLEGSTWWSISPMGARTNDGDQHVTHGTGPGYPLTDPARIPMALDLVLRGTANVAGRDALLLAGTHGGTDGILPRTRWMTSAGPAPTNMNWPLILSGASCFAAKRDSKGSRSTSSSSSRSRSMRRSRPMRSRWGSPLGQRSKAPYLAGGEIRSPTERS